MYITAMSYQFFQIFHLKRCIIIVLVIVCEILTSEVPRPRGVSLSRASLYNPNKNFLCLDGSLTIPFVHINDDFCDCPDGSDEPGTAACPNGIFHCTNAGHKPLNIHSSRVGDGVCDCCDASDEYANDNAKCTNNCNELGRTAREDAQRHAELTKIGNQMRLEYSQKGINLKREKTEKLVELQKHKSEAELILKEKETLKSEAEDLEQVALEQYKQIEEEEHKKDEELETSDTRAEAVAGFEKFDINQDGFVDIAELQTFKLFDKDGNGEVSVEEAKFFLNQQESIDVDNFISYSWPNIKPFLMLNEGLFKPPANKGESNDFETPEVNHNEEEPEQEEDGEGDLEGEEEEDDQEEKTEAPVVSSQPVYDEETQKLIDAATLARKEYNNAKDAVGDIQLQVTKIEDYLEKDYGIDEEYAVLEGQCFDYSDHEYIYRLCPFEKTVQQPKSSSMETRLGTWSRWSELDDNKFMIYDKGQSCWNGPQRTTTVRISCGSDNKLTAVSEPNRCEYQFDFTTPAACKELEMDQGDDLHDEL